MFYLFLTGTISFTILNLAFSFLLPHNVLTNMKLVTDCRTLHIYYFYAALFYYLAEVLENKAKKKICIWMLFTLELISKYHVLLISYFLFLHIYRTFLLPFFIIISAKHINSPFPKCYLYGNHIRAVQYVIFVNQKLTIMLTHFSKHCLVFPSNHFLSVFDPRDLTLRH